MDRIVECVPNFSEGRKEDVVKAITDAIGKGERVKVLDVEMDASHNRSVVTFVGDPEACADAAFEAVKKASELIDMNEHVGEHPRIGATDVVPFIPISGVTTDDCVNLARQLGSRVGEELGIPVYLYEYAATSPERKSLSFIRRGQYEGLKEEIRSDPERKPDYGPSELHPTAGATVIGAREFLIAYNVYLSTSDKVIAQRIAKAIRESSGGLKHVRALGFYIEERDMAQVSMNLVNFRATPVHKVMEAIEGECTKLGVDVVSSEVIGLIPQEALTDSAIFYLKLKEFDKNQIIENRLRE
ncbi:MAG: glutamate formimidoyltransferase [Thermoplasmata archaeon]|nr:glutamate formimidoyltransferase [Thermoplasmata archaeon]